MACGDEALEPPPGVGRHGAEQTDPQQYYYYRVSTVAMERQACMMVKGVCVHLQYAGLGGSSVHRDGVSKYGAVPGCWRCVSAAGGMMTYVLRQASSFCSSVCDRLEPAAGCGDLASQAVHVQIICFGVPDVALCGVHTWAWEAWWLECTEPERQAGNNDVAAPLWQLPLLRHVVF